MPDNQAIPEAILEVVEPDGKRSQARITESPFLIGRASGNHLELADRHISRRSTAVIYAEGTFRVEDQGQRDGLFLNGRKVGVSSLREGDVISFGVDECVLLIFHRRKAQEKLPQVLSRLEQASALAPGTRDLRQLSLLLEATTLLNSYLSPQEVLGEMLDHALTLTDADRGLLLEATPGPGWRPLVTRQRKGLAFPMEDSAPSQTAIKRAFEERRSIIEEDTILADSSLRNAPSIVNQQLRSVVVVPLYGSPRSDPIEATRPKPAEELLGILYLDSRRASAFTQLARQILDALTAEAASVLERTRLLEMERKRQRLQQELEIGREIQQGLLPKAIKQFSFLELAGVSRPCFAVGGDYFDLKELTPDRVAFVIADVSGKGLGAALVTSLLQGSFVSGTPAQEPCQLFTHVNRFMCERSETTRFATAFLGLVDHLGHLEFINAGHHSPLLIRQGKVESPFVAECLPLGIFADADFTLSSASLRIGDTLILFTDGVTDALNIRNEQFGLERLLKAASANATASVQDLQTALVTAIDEFTHGTEQADDITLLILRYQTGESS